MGRAPQGLQSLGWFPADCLSTLGSPGGVRPSTARKIVQDYFWLWGQVTAETAGTSLIAGDSEEHGRPAGLGHPG